MIILGSAVLLCSASESDAGGGGVEPSGDGTSSNPFLITSVDELNWFRDHVNQGNSGKCAKLMSDLNLNGATWDPIKSYAGEFDGGNNSISNFHIDATSSNGGFFITANWANIHDLTLEKITANAGKRFGTLANNLSSKVDNVTIKDVTITTESSSAFVAGLAASGTIYSQIALTNCTVENLTVNAQKGAELIGGMYTFIQRNGSDAEKTNILNNLDVKGFTVVVNDSDGCGVGGLFTQTQTGWQNPRLTDCDVENINIIASGLVDVGGFICWPGAHTITENCTVSGNIDVIGVTSSENYAGGFLGNLGWNCDLGLMGHQIMNCTANVDIITKVATIGGFVGSATNSNNNSMYATFNGCKASGDITSIEGGAANIGGFAGDADRGFYNGCIAEGDVVNNGSGISGGFIGQVKNVTPKYDSRYPAGTRPYHADEMAFGGSTCSNGMKMVGDSETGVVLHTFEESWPCVHRKCKDCSKVMLATAGHTFNSDYPCNKMCIVCGMSFITEEHKPSSVHDCNKKCTVCDEDLATSEHIPNDVACKVTECSVCHVHMDKVDHSPQYGCKDSACSTCGDIIAATDIHDYKIIGNQKVCLICGDVIQLTLPGGTEGIISPDTQTTQNSSNQLEVSDIVTGTMVVIAVAILGMIIFDVVRKP